MLGEEDVKKQIVNKEVEEKPKIEEESKEPRGDAFTLEDAQLKKIVDEVGEKVADPSKYSREIKQIVEYIKATTGAKEYNDVLWEVRLLSNKVGRDSFGASQIMRIYRYVYLNSEKLSIDRELKKFNHVNV